MPTIFLTHGLGLLMISIFMLIPAALEATLATQDWQIFLTASFLSAFMGGLLVLSHQQKHYTLTIRHAYLLTASIWITIAIAAAMPFYLTGTDYHLSFTDAVFESISGLTTTGATVYTGLDDAPRSILLWRSILEWIGGIGIVVFSMTIFPYLRIGGMQLFKSESSDNSDKFLPRVGQITTMLFLVYIGLTTLNILAYYIAGMTGFDAINHGLTTISTGGFSTHDASFGYFESPQIQWLGTFFMIAGGTPLVLYFYLLYGKSPSRPILAQAKAFYTGLFIVSVIMAFYLFHTHNTGVEESLRLSAFNIVSVVTTTGYATTDYSLWGAFAVMVFYFLTIAGGCTGSTSGGIKIFRFMVMAKLLALQFRKLIMPHGVFMAQIGGKKLTDDVISSVGIFFVLFCVLFCIIAGGLALTGLDFITSMSGAATALANVGPGLGEIIGPAGNFVPLSDTAKWLLIFGMLAGRLEILTILILFTRNFWRDFS